MSNKGSVSFSQLLEKAGEKHIPIYTMGYGKEGEINEDELIKLSARTGAGILGIGSFMMLHPKDWALRFEQIQLNIAHLYEISWLPSFPIPDANVNVKLTVDFQSKGEKHRKELDLFYTYTDFTKLKASP
jgi:hypothetical protein